MLMESGHQKRGLDQGVHTLIEFPRYLVDRLQLGLQGLGRGAVCLSARLLFLGLCRPWATSEVFRPDTAIRIPKTAIEISR